MIMIAFQYTKYIMAQKPLLTCLIACALFAMYVAAQGSIDVVVVGNLSKTQHRVSGNVSASTQNCTTVVPTHMRAMSEQLPQIFLRGRPD